MIGIVLAYAAFIISVVWMMLTIFTGCAESEAVRYAMADNPPECTVTVIEEDRFRVKVQVECPGRTYEKTYRKR